MSRPTARYVLPTPTEGLRRPATIETHVESTGRVVPDVGPTVDLTVHGDATGPRRAQVVLVGVGGGRQEDTSGLVGVVPVGGHVGEVETLVEGDDAERSCGETVPRLVTTTQNVSNTVVALGRTTEITLSKLLVRLGHVSDTPLDVPMVGVESLVVSDGTTGDTR